MEQAQDESSNKYVWGGKLGRFCYKFIRFSPKDLQWKMDPLSLSCLEFRVVGLPLSALLQFFPERGILLIADSANVRVRLTVFQLGVYLVLVGES
jgi:hypothetical protein